MAQLNSTVIFGTLSTTGQLWSPSACISTITVSGITCTASLGIGVNPTYKLDVVGEYGAKMARFSAPSACSLFIYGDGAGSGITNADTYKELVYLNKDNCSIHFYTNGTERASISNTGTVTATTFSGSLSGNASSASQLYVNGDYAGDATGRRVPWMDVTVGTAGNRNMYTTSSFYFSPSTGTVTATIFNATSAREKKTNIKDTNVCALKLIEDVKIVDFNFKNDETLAPHIGFIADDTNELFATTKHDSIDLANSIGILIKAVQEMNCEIQYLKKKLEISNE